MKNRPNGFTLVELLIVVAIVSILASLAMPSFNTMRMKRSVQSAAQALVNDMRFARSEALRRSLPVSICSLADGSLNTCSGAVNKWTNGWMVFVETDVPPVRGTRGSTEPIVLVQQPPSSIATIQSSNPSSDRSFFTFEANGWGKTSDQAFVFSATGDAAGFATRLVCVSLNGRPSLRAQGDTACN